MRVSVNPPVEESSLLDAAVAGLAKRLPQTWSISRAQRTIVSAEGSPPELLDGAIELQAPHGTYATIAVEARESFAPRDVERLLPSLARSLRLLAGNVPLLVAAPWLSRRSRELLERERINYFDLTGNVRLQLDNPPVFIDAAGAERNPWPAERGPATARGPRAWRLLRTLADARPPYGVGELAAAAGLTAGYVSRLLSTLDQNALVDRDRRGRVLTVDAVAMLRMWAEGYDVLAKKRTSTYVAPAGAATALRSLASVDLDAVVTGSYAAVRLAPVAAPSLLAVFCREPRRVADALGLLPADDGANVALLRPFDDVVVARASTEDGVRYAAPSQVAVDCLSGNGRMPAEGEAVLEWLIAHEDEWRVSSLQGLKIKESTS